jgi:hypothetical protein
MKASLWFPDGVRKGDVVYDLDSNPFLIREAVTTGANIRNIEPITKDQADAHIRAGAQRIISTKE